MISKAVGAAIGGVVVYVVGAASFERFAPPRWVRAYQRFANPLFGPVMGTVLGWAVVETIGRNSGQPRQVPVGGRLRGNSFWLVAGESRRSKYLKNIEANPTVRLRVHGRWRSGTAHVLADDNPRRRLLHLNPLNSLFVWIAGKDLVTIRVDLEHD